MNLDQLRDSDRILFECIGGSHAYGTNTPNSDHDHRGIFSVPKEEYLGLSNPPEQIGDEKQDILFYSLKRFFELAKKANPNIIELLWMPDDMIQKTSPEFVVLKNHRHLFISKACKNTHIGYAYSQISKAKGANKRVNNPQPEKRPQKEDFCWVIGNESSGPMRSIPLKNLDIDLSKYNASSVEHIGYLYRLYFYGDKASGVFRGDDMLVCESIPKEDEKTKFAHLMIFNKPEYERSLREWKQYWDWMKNRNESRWVDQEKGILDYDQKNMCHTIRLLLSGENILRNGFPIVRFEGQELKYLRDIRAGKLPYQEILDDAERRVETIEQLHDTLNVIPEKVDDNAIDQLYRSIS